MSRDIVQFVPLRQFQSRGGANFSLAKETLAEIPTQLLSFMRSKGIKPNPPPLRRYETFSQQTPGKYDNSNMNSYVKGYIIIAPQLLYNLLCQHCNKPILDNRYQHHPRLHHQVSSSTTLRSNSLSFTSTQGNNFNKIPRTTPEHKDLHPRTHH